MQLHLGIDVGKTNLRAAVFRGATETLARWSVPSTEVSSAVQALRSWLTDLPKTYRIAAVGLSTFGPLQTDPSQPDYGAIVGSSEPAWSGINLPAAVAAAAAVPVFFDHDVQAGALAEALTGSGQGKRSFVYLSVGTGVGAAPFFRSRAERLAPQAGHIYLPREPDDVAFAGSCRFHGACLQGLASGHAMAQRWGIPAERLPASHPAWNLQARYLARACANLVYTLSPETIVLGSSVGTSASLDIDLVERHTRLLLNDFLEPELRTRYAAAPIVQQSLLGADSSLQGAAHMARLGRGLPYPPRNLA